MRSIPCLPSMWRVLTWIQILASLNHRKKMKAEPCRLIPWKLTGNLKLLITAKICAVLKTCEILLAEKRIQRKGATDIHVINANAFWTVQQIALIPVCTFLFIIGHWPQQHTHCITKGFYKFCFYCFFTNKLYGLWFYRMKFVLTQYFSLSRKFSI